MLLLVGSTTINLPCTSNAPHAENDTFLVNNFHSAPPLVVLKIPPSYPPSSIDHACPVPMYTTFGFFGSIPIVVTDKSALVTNPFVIMFQLFPWSVLLYIPPKSEDA